MKAFLTLAMLAVSTASWANVVANDTPSGESSLAGYHLKNRSTASSNVDAARPPFWPIGYARPVAGAPEPVQVAPTQAKMDISMFSVTSILLGQPSVAIINGRAYSEGEFLRTPRVKDPATQAAPAIPAKVRVQKIADGTVVLALNGETVTVPLRRPQLNDRKDSEQLLSEER